MKFYYFLIKTVESPVKWLFSISLFIVGAYIFILSIGFNFSNRCQDLLSALFTIAASVITGVIVYILTAHKPAMENTHRTIGEVIWHFEKLKGNLESILNFTFEELLKEPGIEELFIDDKLQEMDHIADEDPTVTLNFADWGTRYEDRVCFHVEYIKRTSLADVYIFALLKQTEDTVCNLQRWYDNTTGPEVLNKLVPLSVFPSDIGAICQDIDSLLLHLRKVYEEDKDYICRDNKRNTSNDKKVKDSGYSNII